jgi:hypothetical protein
MVGAVARAGQTATLLIDGRVLVAGGTDGGPAPMPTQVWDLDAHTATTIGSDAVTRTGQTATLMGDGRVLITAGQTLDGARAGGSLVIDPASGAVQTIDSGVQPEPSTMVAASSPASSSEDVPADARIALRFSAPVMAASLTVDALSLTGPDGPVTTRVILAEGGRLAFVWPAARLSDGTEYHADGVGGARPTGSRGRSGVRRLC